ncbi:MAG TPA: penicillin-binding protein 2 [Dissulfurispiraceae bacterium]|nr:penicillin-binding protein 2 [Dissulfurispiraceae bacterium]
MVSKKKIQLGFLVVTGVLSVILLRLIQLQIIDGTMYRQQSENNRLRIMSSPAPRGIIYDRNGIALVKNVPFYSAYIMYDPTRRIDTAALSLLMNEDRQILEAKLNRQDNSPFVPIRLKQGLSFQEVARLEARRSDFPGLFIQTDVGRSYPFGKTGAHVIGYLGKMTPSQASSAEFHDLPPETLVGQWGVEALYDKQLRGVAGGRFIEVDALGREHRLIRQNPALRGQDVKLSIDIRMQKAVEEAFGEKAGALVALKVDTGEVLALESLPSFDPNQFTDGISSADWKKLTEDKRKPMMNRALQSQYPPGSTFKIVVAIAGLEEGVITPDTRVNCTGGIKYGKWTFGCWKHEGHGIVDLHKAIRESCDVYFYEVGKRLGIDKINKYAMALGLGKPTGLALVKERSGLIPSAEWKRAKRGQEWYLGETLNAAIGQGYVAATPMQLALMMTTVVNGGRVLAPTLIDDPKEISIRSKIDLKPETLRLVKDGLSAVVNENGGTAKVAESTLVKIGGKTGTAQVVGKAKSLLDERYMDHAWFVAFAPVDKPEIALSVFVEHGGHGGSAAAPLAKKAIEAYFNDKSATYKQSKSDAAVEASLPSSDESLGISR